MMMMVATFLLLLGIILCLGLGDSIGGSTPRTGESGQHSRKRHRRRRHLQTPINSPSNCNTCEGIDDGFTQIRGTNCGAFAQCVRGRVVDKSACQAGTIFDASLNQCNWESTTTCGPDPDCPTLTPSAPPTMELLVEEEEANGDIVYIGMDDYVSATISPTRSHSPTGLPTEEPWIFLCDIPSGGCKNGMFNQVKCECECIPPFCRAMNGECTNPSNNCGENPWEACTRGVNCPWWVNPMEGESCTTGPEVPMGTWQIYNTMKACCITNFPYSNSCIVVPASNQPTKHPTMAALEDYEVIPIRFDVMGLPDGVEMRDLKGEMAIVLKRILLRVADSIPGLKISSVEELVVMPNRNLLGVLRALEQDVTVYYNVYAIRDENRRFGPMIISEIRENYSEVLGQIQAFTDTKYFEESESLDVNLCTTSQNGKFDICVKEITPPTPPPKYLEMVKLEETEHLVQLNLKNVADGYLLSPSDRASLIRFIKDLLEDNLADPFRLVEVAYTGGDVIPSIAGNRNSDGNEKVDGRSESLAATHNTNGRKLFLPRRLGAISLPLRVVVAGHADLSDFALSYVMDVLQDHMQELVWFIQSLDWNAFKNVDVLVQLTENDALDDLFPPTKSPSPTYSPTEDPIWMDPQTSEYNALLALYKDTYGDSWTRNDGWLSDLNVCVWYGVKCNTDNKVTALVLSSNGLYGQLSNEQFAQLTHIETIDFSNNRLWGSIPEDIGNPIKLKNLILGNNKLGGAIPSSLSRLPMLEELDLRHNALHSLWISNGGYNILRSLHLDNNSLEGTIPDKIYSMKALELLSMQRNRLFGTVSQNISSLVNLTVLDLSFNSLESPLPQIDLEYLNINVVGNRLVELNRDWCLNDKWNSGDVGRYGCDGIACSLGTANAQGRQSSDTTPCTSCKAAATFVGTVNCIDEAQSRVCELECLNGGTCAKGISSWNDFCVCRGGFSGTRCESTIVYSQRPTPPPSLVSGGFVSSNPPSLLANVDCGLECLNGGFCSRATFGWNEWCSCPLGFSGTQCELQTVYRPTPPPVSLGAGDFVSSDCTFYAINGVGRLSSFESFCGGGAGYADLGLPLSDIAVDPISLRAIGQRGTSMFEFDLDDGSIQPGSFSPNFGEQDLKVLFDAIEFSNGKLYGVGQIDLGNGAAYDGVTLYEMNSVTLEIESRGPVFSAPIVGLAHRSKEIMYAISSCDTDSNYLWEIGLDTKRATIVCDLPVCIDSITYHPYEDALYGGTADGCIARIIVETCTVLDCDTSFGWSSHFDTVKGLSVVCPTSMAPPSPVVTIPYNSEDERQHLSKFYDFLSGSRWVNATNWLSDEVDHCSWHGIQCDDTGSVTGVNLPQNRLAGALAEASRYLTYLPKLETLNLSGNWRLSGTMPSLEGLTLEALDLGSNSLSGTLSGDFLSSSAETLQHIDLSQNRLSGYLHDWSDVWRPSLRYLNFSSNALASSIPVEIGINMHNLEYIDLSNNQFTYEFQETYYRELRNLKSLRLAGNRLSGELPSYETVFYPALREVDVSHNYMRGDIPESIFNNDSIVNRTLTLDISHNDFGPVFPNLVNLRRLNVIAVGNDIERIDENVCQNFEWNNGDLLRFGCDGLMCPPMTFNSVGRQSLSKDPCLPCEAAIYYGTTECTIKTMRPTPQPSSIGYNERYDALLTFYRYTNGGSWTRNDGWLSADLSVCEWYGVRCNKDNNVVALMLLSNNLKGYLDSKLFAQLPFIKTIDLSDNSLSGEIFEPCIRCYPELQVLNLRNNSLSGRLSIRSSNWLGELLNFPKLERLLLSYNSLSGTLVADYSSIPSLRELDLGTNMLSGPLVGFNDRATLTNLNVSGNFLT